MRLAHAVLATCLLAAPGFAQTDVHAPVAVRWWGQGMVSIETWWGLTVVIDPYNDKIGYQVPDLTADLLLVTHEHFDHNNVEAVKGNPFVFRALDDDGQVRELFNYLGRAPNAAKPVWQPNLKATSAEQPDHSLFVRTVPAWHDDSRGSQRGATSLFVVAVDGVRIAHCGDLGQSKLTEHQLAQLQDIDVMLLPVGGVYTIDGNQAWEIVEQAKPRIVVPMHYKTDRLTIPLEPVDKFVEHMPTGWKLDKPGHNTLAVAASESGEDASGGRLVLLSYQPWQPKGELAELLDQMDKSCRSAQEVFVPLTANQMNWQPPNGTHTPRWNAEHMMGRQLGFFSQIYAAIDPADFTHIDWNPAQMPPDFKPAHPDWSGAEEARQLERANAYVHRFAYLLDGLDLDQPAPGSRWTLRGLCQQMDRHFAEHTENVKKKFELAGWPTQ